MSSIARVAFLALIVWVPIPLGSNRPIFWVINAVLVTLILGMLLFGSVSRPIPGPASKTMSLVLIATLAGIGWMLLQAAHWTPPSIHHPFWQTFGGDGIDSEGAISINPSATYSTALQVLTAALAGIIAARISLTRARSEHLLIAVLVSSLFVAVWGLAAVALDWQQTLFDQRGPSSQLTSFFVNRNTTAVFIGLGLVANSALMITRLKEWRPAPGWLPVIVDFPAKTGVFMMVYLLLGAALLTTASRAGIAAAVLGCLATFAVSWQRRSRKPISLALGSLAIFATLMMFLGASSARLFERLGQLDFADDARWQFYRDTLAAIADRPLLGHGAGTFADFYPFYRSPDAPEGVLLAAHNTYLQAAAELGIPLVLAGLAVLFILVGVCVRGARNRAEPLAAAIAAVGATVVLAVHSLFEFSLQIQSIAICFAAMLGAGVSIVALRPRDG